MKKIFFAFALLPALLVSCGTGKPTGDKVDGNDTSNNDNTNNGGDTNNGDSDGGDTSITEALRTWKSSETALMKEHLNDFVIPSFTAAEGAWTYDAEYNCVTYQAAGNNNSVTKIYNELMATDLFEEINAPGKIDNYFGAEVVHYFPETEKVSYVDIDIYVNNGTLSVDAYLFTYYKDWNDAAIKECLKACGVTNYTLPKPNFTMTAFEIFEVAIEEGIFTLYCHTEVDKSSEYNAQLDALGYLSQPQSLEGVDYNFKVDPTTKIGLDVYFDAEYGDTAIDVYVGFFE